MRTAVRRCLAVLLVLCLSFSPARPARADIAYTKDSKAIGVIVAVVAVGAVIGIGVYYAMHHGHSLKGCATRSASGLDLVSEGDSAHWALTGDTQGIKAGDRVHVNGSKVKGGSKTFAVTKLSKGLWRVFGSLVTARVEAAHILLTGLRRRPLMAMARTKASAR